jgi:hypothetical protein
LNLSNALALRCVEVFLNPFYVAMIENIYTDLLAPSKYSENLKWEDSLGI